MLPSLCQVTLTVTFQHWRTLKLGETLVSNANPCYLFWSQLFVICISCLHIVWTVTVSTYCQTLESWDEEGAYCRLLCCSCLVWYDIFILGIGKTLFCFYKIHGKIYNQIYHFYIIKCTVQRYKLHSQYQATFITAVLKLFSVRSNRIRHLLN